MAKMSRSVNTGDAEGTVPTQGRFSPELRRKIEDIADAMGGISLSKALEGLVERGIEEWEKDGRLGEIVRARKEVRS